jgi:hypothetical protein
MSHLLKVPSPPNMATLKTKFLTHESMENAYTLYPNHSRDFKETNVPKNARGKNDKN